MFELVCSAGGIALFFISRSTKAVPFGIVSSLTVALLVLSAFTFIAWGSLKSLRCTCISCFFLRTWSPLLAVLGAAVVWVILVLTVRLYEVYGPKPATAEAVTLTSAIGTLLGAIATRSLKLGEAASAARFTRWTIRKVFRDRVGRRPLYVDDDNAQLLAHRAVEEDEFAIPDGSVKGWSCRACCQRTKLIRTHLMPPS